MPELIKKKCLQFSFYAVVLVISWAVQGLHPEAFAIFCTPVPFGNSLNSQDRPDLPLNSPVVPFSEIGE